MTVDRSARKWLPGMVAIAIVVIAVVAEFARPLNGDAHWILTMAGRVAGGETLYRDILEINPPLIVWLQLPLVWLARWLGVDPDTVFRIAVVILAIASATVCAALLGRDRSESGEGMTRWALPSLLVVLLVLPGGAFGQREQLITLLLLPYVVMQSLRADGWSPARGSAVAIGLAAGLAIAIKPHFIGVWLLASGYRAWVTRRYRLEPEDAAIVVTGTGYVLSVAILAPAFFQVVRIFGPTYLGFGRKTPAEILASAAVIWFGTALLGWFSSGRRGAWKRLGDLLAIAGVGSICAVVLQGKGWSYQFLPTVCFAVLLGGLSLYRNIPGRGSFPQRLSGFIASVLLLASWVPLGHQVAARLAKGSDPRSEDPEVRAMAAAVGGQRGARSILVLSADMTSALPWMTDLGLSSRNSFPYLWVPTALYKPRRHPDTPVVPHSPSQMTPVERTAFEAVVNDFRGHPPDLLVVETPKRNAALMGVRTGFDHLRYYGADRGFAAALRSYAPTDSVPGFVIYRRQPQELGRPGGRESAHED